MGRDFADFWNLLWEVALLGLAALALLDHFAPPQHLPWKPLDLNQPVGAATASKVSDFELSRTAHAEEIRAQTEACMQTLRDAGVEVVRAEDIDDGQFCVVRGAVRITGGVTPIRPAGQIMQCPLAVRYVIWDRQVLQPLASEMLGAQVASVESYGTYSCRRIYGLSGPENRPSEHARANAIDIASITLSDGRRISLSGDWEGQGRAGEEGSRFLRRLRDGACRIFPTVLGPEYNEAHADHFHFDGSGTGLCR
ncbi:MAG: extensin family protein [Brevundimonas sp.]|jgi:hypothetical protein|uniref:extensin-like domain-containing protein n=1 Tax=Brevundimonas sp. TaxID=1871086 RepID=UPI003918D28F